MIEAYINMWKNTFDFSGRSRRRDYWLAVLANLIIYIVLRIICVFFSFFIILHYLYAITVVVPYIALCVRRMHDIGQSGWWLLLWFVPILGGIAILIFTCLDSDSYNDYGPNPKEVCTDSE